MNRSAKTSALLLAVLLAGCGKDIKVALSPQNPTVEAGATVAFAAEVTGSSNAAVTWTVTEGDSGGTITSSGLYTAPATPGSFEVVATSAADPKKSASTHVTVTAPPAGVTVQLSPEATEVGLGGFARFTATVSGAADTSVTWSVEEGPDGGSVSAAGTYTAPMFTGTYHVVATSVADPSRSAKATVTVSAAAIVSLAVSPEAASLVASASQQFSATVSGTTNLGVDWSVKESAGGFITAAGLYTAPATAGTFHVIATSQADTTKSAEATVTVTPGSGVTVGIAPSTVTVAAGGTQAFAAAVAGSADLSVGWSVQEGAAGGTIDTAGLYTAPLAAGTFHVVATATADPLETAVATVTVTAPQNVQVRITPTTGTVPPNGTFSLSATVSGAADTSVTWAVQEGAAGGTLAATGSSAVYTAPATNGTYHVVVTSVADTSKSATATLSVLTLPVTVTVAPGSVTLAPNGTQTFTATVANATNTAVTWSITQGAAGGTVSTTGEYVAPATAGNYELVATSVEDPAKSGTAEVRVLPVGGYTITGTVAYSGTRTGRVYVVIKDTFGTHVAGTSLAAPGPFTVRGVLANGNLTAFAFIDALDNATYNVPADPVGVAALTLPGSTTAALTLTDPAPPPPDVPAQPQVIPGEQTALVYFNAVYDAQGFEAADHYRIYWSTGTNPGPGDPLASSLTVRAATWLAAIPSAQLPNGNYYFSMSALAAGQESAPCAPQPVTIGSSGGRNVSGTVTFQGSAPGGSLYLLAWGNTTRALKVAAPVSPAAFTVTHVPTGTYYLYAVLDVNGDGEISATDMTSFQSTLMVQVSGGPVTGQNIALPTGDAISSVTTNHTEGASGASYDLAFMALANARQPVKMTVTSGPNLAGPIDVAVGDSYHYAKLELGAIVPTVGQSYTFELTYADATTATATAAVTGVIAGFPNPTSPKGTGSANPTFTWTAPSPAPAGAYGYRLTVYDGTSVAWSTQLSSSSTSTVYNSDGYAYQPSLTSGATATWYLGVRDANGNSSYGRVATFTVQ